MKRSGFLIALLMCTMANLYAQHFSHPGLNQGRKDLDYMRQLVLQGKQPWKDAFSRLKAAADTAYTPHPHTHVLRGPYGKPNIGGDDLAKDADRAYNNALLWYITRDTVYAGRAMRLLQAWTPLLWDFDYNDAKLLAAWTGHVWCNAAEILRYTYPGWKQEDTEAFSHMLLTVYWPLLRYYFPQANGNWDGAIIHSILAIAVFTDNREMFSQAIDHFLHAPFNGSLFKYVYPSGQCQESLRDQGHVQLGLGEFAGAAQLAFTQGADLFSIAGNRLGLGFEYTARFLLGETPHCYGTISARAKLLRDDYEYVYRHYTARGVVLPFVQRAADSIRPKAARSILTAVRTPLATAVARKVRPVASTIGYIAGAGAAVKPAWPADVLQVAPGEPVQKALDAAAGTGRWVLLKAGIHILPASLKIPSGITLCGEGLSTVVFLDPASADRDAMVNAVDDLHDVTLRDLVMEGSNKTDPGTDPNSNRTFKNGYNRGGIVFRAQQQGQMRNIQLLHITVQHCTYNGIFISGGDRIDITGCDVNENGAGVVPGPKLQHNVLLTHCRGIRISDSRLDTSPFGAGICCDHCSNVEIAQNEIARNGYYGVLLTESNQVSVRGNLVEANDRSGVMAEYLSQGCAGVRINGNTVQYNNGYGVELYAATNTEVSNNTYAGNGRAEEQQKISGERRVGVEW